MGHTGQAPQGPQPLPGIGAVIAVGSGKGGVGKTTLSVNLAIALAKLGHRVGLIDADIYGPNVPMMMGQTRQPSVTENSMMEPLESYGVKFISVGLISPGDKPLVMRGPMSPDHPPVSAAGRVGRARLPAGRSAAGHG